MFWQRRPTQFFRLRTKHVVIAITVFDGPFGPLTSCEPALNGTKDLVRRFGHCGVNLSEFLQRMLPSRRLHPKAVATLSVSLQAYAYLTHDVQRHFTFKTYLCE